MTTHHESFSPPYQFDSGYYCPDCTDEFFCSFHDEDGPHEQGELEGQCAPIVKPLELDIMYPCAACRQTTPGRFHIYCESCSPLGGEEWCSAHA